MIPFISNHPVISAMLLITAIFSLLAYFKVKFSRRKYAYFGREREKHIAIELYGFDSTPSIALKFDGTEREVTFSICCFMSIYITFSRMMSKRWFPSYWSDYTESQLSDEREIQLAIHGGAFWWTFWMKPYEWNSKDSKWRRGSFQFVDLLKGKHKMIETVLMHETFLVPMLEGNYRCKVTKKNRVDKWKRWFTRKMITWEVNYGYQYKGQWVVLGIPHQGKGENSWDQGESYSAGLSFWEYAAGKENRIVTCYQAMCYAQQSIMKTRERYGRKDWSPAKSEVIPTIRNFNMERAIDNGGTNYSKQRDPLADQPMDTKA